MGTAAGEPAAALAAEPVRETVDWEHVHVLWGDERFVPGNDEERNEKQAREALLSRVGVPEHHIHAMPPSDGEFAGPEEAAAWYARELAAAAPEGAAVPRLDLLLLGMGPEGHVASIFPHSPAVEDAATVVADCGCPKPPPTRVSLGFAAINAAEEVWLLVSGAGKAAAVARALSGADAAELPAAGVHGTRAT